MPTRELTLLWGRTVPQPGVGAGVASQRKGESDEDWKARNAASNRAYRERNPEKVKSAQRNWAAANPERVKAHGRASYVRNAGKIKAAHRVWAAANRETVRAAQRRWSAANIERRLLQSVRTRARRSGRPCNLTTPLSIPGHCECCEREIVSGVGKGGASESSPSYDCLDASLGYVEGNVRVICLRCNRIKNDGTADDHRTIAQYIDRHLRVPRSKP